MPIEDDEATRLYEYMAQLAEAISTVAKQMNEQTSLLIELVNAKRAEEIARSKRVM